METSKRLTVFFLLLVLQVSASKACKLELNFNLARKEIQQGIPIKGTVSIRNPCNQSVKFDIGSWSVEIIDNKGHKFSKFNGLADVFVYLYEYRDDDEVLHLKPGDRFEKSLFLNEGLKKLDPGEYKIVVRIGVIEGDPTNLIPSDRLHGVLLPMEVVQNIVITKNTDDTDQLVRLTRIASELSYTSRTKELAHELMAYSIDEALIHMEKIKQYKHYLLKDVLVYLYNQNTLRADFLIFQLTDRYSSDVAEMLLAHFSDDRIRRLVKHVVPATGHHSDEQIRRMARADYVVTNPKGREMLQQFLEEHKNLLAPAGAEPNRESPSSRPESVNDPDPSPDAFYSR